MAAGPRLAAEIAARPGHRARSRRCGSPRRKRGRRRRAGDRHRPRCLSEGGRLRLERGFVRRRGRPAAHRTLADRQRHLRRPAQPDDRPGRTPRHPERAPHATIWPGIGNDYLNAKLSTLYTSQANLERDFNVTADLLLMANRTPSADPDVDDGRHDRDRRRLPGLPAVRIGHLAGRADGDLQPDDRHLRRAGGRAGAAVAAGAVNTLAISVLARPARSACCAPSVPPGGRSGGW